jgi:dTDP-glucose 4,6-dehydratase
METLLVTGAAGFIASTYVRQRLAAGDSVVVLDKLTYAGHPENLDATTDSSCADLAKANGGSYVFVQGDIADPKLVAELFATHRPDAIVNFAAESHVDNSITGPAAFIATNVGGTFNLLEQALRYFRELSPEKKSKFRFLQVSTDEVYGSLGAEGKFSETTPYAPNSPYSASKASADLLVRAWFHTYGLPTITTNCSNNYGPRQFPEKLIPLMISNALEGKPLPVYGDGGNIRDWIHVDDHCTGVQLALVRGVPGETYCFGGNAERNNLEVVKTICAELDKAAPRSDGKKHEIGIAFVQDRLGHDRRYAIDDTKARKKLGFSTRYAFPEGIRATIQWYLENRPWTSAVTRPRSQKRTI